MKDIEYKYCVDGDNNLICIDEITKENYDHQYKGNLFCLQCGNGMTAKVGKIKEHHFAHKVNCACDGESYLHKLAKELFKQSFNSASFFPLKYYTNVTCDSTLCPYKKDECKIRKQKTINLKDLYQHCNIEEEIKDQEGNSYIADILLTSDNKDIKPILVEIYVMHECSEQKKNSGLQIVELKIDMEDDILQLQRKCAIEEGGSVRLYNFERNIKEPLATSITRYVYNSNGTSSLKNISCKDANKVYDENSLLEFNIMDENHFRLNQDFDKYISDRCGFNIESCKTCLHLQSNKTYKYLEESMPPYCYEIKEKCEDYKRIDVHKFCGHIPSDNGYVLVKGHIPEAYNVLIHGPHSYQDFPHIKKIILYYLQNKIGKEYVVLKFAWSQNSKFTINIIKLSLDIELPCETVYVDWMRYKKSAPYECIPELIKDISAAIVFNDDKDGPTLQLLNQLKMKNKIYREEKI